MWNDYVARIMFRFVAGYYVYEREKREWEKSKITFTMHFVFFLTFFFCHSRIFCLVCFSFVFKFTCEFCHVDKWNKKKKTFSWQVDLRDLQFRFWWDEVDHHCFFPCVSTFVCILFRCCLLLFIVKINFSVNSINYHQFS